MGMDAADFLFTAILLLLAVPLGVVAIPVAAVVLTLRWVWRKAHPRTEKLPSAVADAYAYLDESVSEEQVAAAVRDHTDDPVLGSYAQDVLNTFALAALRRKGIFALLEDQFTSSSLTWDKFSAPVEVALDKIVRNAAQIVNRIQAFDSKEYQRMGRLERAGAYDEGRAELRRLATMRSTLEEMDDIQEANDQLLSELEKLQASLTTMAGSGADAETNEIVSEIRKLSDDTRYYTQA